MKIEAEGKNEFERFSNTLKKVLKVPHSQIKAMLDEEKATKKRKKSKKSSASVRAVDGRA